MFLLLLSVNHHSLSGMASLFPCTTGQYRVAVATAREIPFITIYNRLPTRPPVCVMDLFCNKIKSALPFLYLTFISVLSQRPPVRTCQYASSHLFLTELLVKVNPGGLLQLETMLNKYLSGMKGLTNRGCYCTQ